jgi:hypothetical protein
MKPLQSILALSLTLLAEAAFAQDGDKAAKDKLHADITTCIAYYAYSQQCIGPNGPKAVSDAIDRSMTWLKGASYDTGMSIGLSPETMLDRLQASLDEQKALIKADCKNIALLNERHGARCKRLVENSDSILQEHLGTK